MMNMRRKQPSSFKRKLLIVMIVVLLGFGTVIYSLADRYLIEHVEVVIADDTAAAGVNTAATTVAAGVDATSDDWSYSSGDIQIEIDQVQTGSGSDQITYFVADVVLKDASSLRSAFADNSFGTNIIEDTSEICLQQQCGLCDQRRLLWLPRGRGHYPQWNVVPG